MSKELDEQMQSLRKMAEESGVDMLELLEKAKRQLLKNSDGDTPEAQAAAASDPEAEAREQAAASASMQASAWDRVLLARHADRPTALRIIDKISDQYIELRGDRFFADDAALVGGICTIGGVHFTFLGNQKGSNMKENIQRNYGMAHPEGYRKALRLAKQAEQFRRPILTLIDTSGAYPGLASEERGIGQAIAENLMVFSALEVPVICIIIGEGGSGGALGIGIGDKIFMLENAVYSVISPEGFASILLHDAKRMKEAAALMKMTAQDVLQFGFIDGIIPEPEGGAHLDLDTTAENIKNAVLHAYAELRIKDVSQLIQQRSKKIINWTRAQREMPEKNKKFLQRIKEFFVE